MCLYPHDSCIIPRVCAFVGTAGGEGQRVRGPGQGQYEAPHMDNREPRVNIFRVSALCLDRCVKHSWNMTKLSVDRMHARIQNARRPSGHDHRPSGFAWRSSKAKVSRPNNLEVFKSIKDACKVTFNTAP